MNIETHDESKTYSASIIDFVAIFGYIRSSINQFGVVAASEGA